MNQDIFDKETAMCRSLQKDNDGKCNWGECSKCGVIPFMYKIFKGELIEDSSKIEKVKKEIFNQ